MNNPPTNVKMVNAAVMAALGNHETWEMGKKVMKQSNVFLNQLLDYDVENVSLKVIEKLEKYV